MAFFYFELTFYVFFFHFFMSFGFANFYVVLVLHYHVYLCAFKHWQRQQACQRWQSGGTCSAEG
jgi:hypothetical protein